VFLHPEVARGCARRGGPWRRRPVQARRGRGTGRCGRARTTWRGGRGGIVGGREEMQMTGGSKGKVVFSNLLSCKIFSLFSVVCSRPKALYHGVLDTKSSLAMCAVQNYFFTVYCGQISLFLSLPRERETFYHCPKFTIHLVRKCSNMCLHSPRSGSNETAARQQLSHSLRF